MCLHIEQYRTDFALYFNRYLSVLDKLNKKRRSSKTFGLFQSNFENMVAELVMSVLRKLQDL